MKDFNALAKAAFVPILTAFLVNFFAIMVNIATGLATREPELEDVLRVLEHHATGWTHSGAHNN